jgi:hypothetical protein
MQFVRSDGSMEAWKLQACMRACTLQGASMEKSLEAMGANRGRYVCVCLIVIQTLK